MHVYLVTVSSVHNDERDDSGSQDRGNPVHDQAVFVNRDTALLVAEQHLFGALDGEGEDEPEIEQHEHVNSDTHVYDAIVTTWHSITHITVDRQLVIEE